MRTSALSSPPLPRLLSAYKGLKLENLNDGSPLPQRLLSAYKGLKRSVYNMVGTFNPQFIKCL